MASFFGPVSYWVESEASRLRVRVELDETRKSKELAVHLRHPDEAEIKGVVLNGETHLDYGMEVVRVSSPEAVLEIAARYV
jgi:hypothetical protein